MVYSGSHSFVATYIGYLDHPFKNRHFGTEKEILSLLATKGASVYDQTPSATDSCLDNDIFIW